MDNRRRNTMAAALAMVVLSAVPFLETQRFGLVWDDSQLLAQVGRTAQAGGTSRLFSSDFRLTSDWPTGYYRPVTTSALWFQIKGAWNQGGAGAITQAARALHIVNLLIHGLCCLFVWMLLRQVAGSQWAAWLGAALFAVHPVHVEPVSFISARADLLATLFVLGSVLCWLKARRAAGRTRIAAVVAGSLLALAGSLAKDHALLLPVVLIVWMLLLEHDGHRKLARNKDWIAGWLVATAIALWLRTQVAHVGAGPDAIPGTGSAHAFTHLGLPALLLYLKLWYFPWPLNTYYMERQLGVGMVELACVVATVVLVVIAFRRGKGREAAAALAFTFIFLLPVLHLTPLWGAVAAERFLYLPSVGLAMCSSLALAALEGNRIVRATSRGIAWVVIALFIPLTMNGTRAWESDETLFARMLETSPRAPMAHQGMGDVLIRAGRLSEAELAYRQAIVLQPDFVNAHLQLGIVCAMQGRAVEARESFETALRFDPNRVAAHSNLGVLEMSQLRYDAAIVHLQRALELDPYVPRTHYRMGQALLATGDVIGAEEQAAILDKLDPEMARQLRAELSHRAPER